MYDEMSQNETDKDINALYTHPLSAIVAGPSGVGKTTFLANLLKRSNEMFNVDFRYITIYIGTKLEESGVWMKLKKEMPHIQFVEIWTEYKNAETMQKIFKNDFLAACRKQGSKGFVVFDDLMSEVSRCDILSDLFSKNTSKCDLTVFHLTQNMFYKGKDPNEHVTMYRNSHMLVLFHNPMDTSVTKTIAKRFETGERYQRLLNMFTDVMKRFRYIIIYPSFDRHEKLQYTSDIFNTEPFPFQRVFYLE